MKKALLYISCLIVTANISNVCWGQTDLQDLRKQLIQEIDKKLQEVRRELIDRIDKKLSLSECNYLGAFLKPIPDSIRKLMNLSSDEGVLVVGVDAASPAEHAGMKSMDIMLSFADQKVKSVEEVNSLVSGLQAGTLVKAEILRNQQKITVNIVIEKRAKLAIPSTKIHEKLWQELDRDFSSIKDKAKKWGNRAKYLQKFLEDPENQIEIEKFLKSGKDYLESLKNDPEFPKKLKDRLESLKDSLKKHIEEGGEFSEEMEDVLEQILRFHKSIDNGKIEKEIDSLLDDLLDEPSDKPSKEGKK